MDHSPNPPDQPRPRQPTEFEDPGYHDDVEVVLPDDDTDHRPHSPVPRKPSRRPPPRRRYYED